MSFVDKKCHAQTKGGWQCSRRQMNRTLCTQHAQCKARGTLTWHPESPEGRTIGLPPLEPYSCHAWTGAGHQCSRRQVKGVLCTHHEKCRFNGTLRLHPAIVRAHLDTVEASPYDAPVPRTSAASGGSPVTRASSSSAPTRTSIEDGNSVLTSPLSLYRVHEEQLAVTQTSTTQVPVTSESASHAAVASHGARRARQPQIVDRPPQESSTSATAQLHADRVVRGLSTRRLNSAAQPVVHRGVPQGEFEFEFAHPPRTDRALISQTQVPDARADHIRDADAYQRPLFAPVEAARNEGRAGQLRFATTTAVARGAEAHAEDLQLPERNQTDVLRPIVRLRRARVEAPTQARLPAPPPAAIAHLAAPAAAPTQRAAAAPSAPASEFSFVSALLRYPPQLPAVPSTPPLSPEHSAATLPGAYPPPLPPLAPASPPPGDHCCVCWEDACDVQTLPCKHTHTCADCARVLFGAEREQKAGAVFSAPAGRPGLCPYCRTDVMSWMRVQVPA